MKKQPQPEPETQVGVPVVERAAAVCLRCGWQWFPRVEHPARCPHCSSALWDTPRAQRLPGKPPPTRKGKARGASFDSESATRAINKRHAQNAQKPVDSDETS